VAIVLLQAVKVDMRGGMLRRRRGVLGDAKIGQGVCRKHGFIAWEMKGGSWREAVP
jgi:hypothetical protein